MLVALIVVAVVLASIAGAAGGYLLVRRRLVLFEESVATVAGWYGQDKQRVVELGQKCDESADRAQGAHLYARNANAHLDEVTARLDALVHAAACQGITLEEGVRA